MLYPQANRFRQSQDLSGFWDFRFDPEDRGRSEGWINGFEQAQPIAVPASWNEQFANHRDYLGPAWYQTRFDLPWGWEQQQIFVRFGSINYLAQVWLNGVELGSHEGGHLPFEFALSPSLRAEGNILVVRVEGFLAPDRVPPGNGAHSFADQVATYPDANFDFFPYCGIQRPVLLYAVPQHAITDLPVTTH